MSAGSPSGPDPGWYPDPWNQAPLRWFDGSRWTGQTSGYAPAPETKKPFLRGPVLVAAVVVAVIVSAAFRYWLLQL